MTKRGIHIVFLFFFCFQINSQNKSDSLAVIFQLEFNKLPLETNRKYISESKDTLTIETFRCYISNIQIQYTNNSVYTQKESYYLLDLEHPNSFRIPITKNNNKPISKITFNIGIDSLTNTSGAMAGDLDPIKGMYWAWQSGYINTKIEGKSSSCKTRNNEFQFHIGGYLQPYYAMRKKVITLNLQSNQDINIVIDASIFFADIQLNKTSSLMIPGKAAMELADICSKMFFIE